MGLSSAECFWKTIDGDNSTEIQPYLQGGPWHWQALPGKNFALPAEGQAGNSAPAAGGNTELASLTLAEAAARLRARQVTSVELTEACLERIEIYNPKLDAFITVTRQQALAAARQADAEIKGGKYRGRLHGIPFAAKDNIDTAGIRTTAGSALFEDRVPAEDAPVNSLLKARGGAGGQNQPDGVCPRSVE